jgi:hypothetical protein
MAGKGDMNITPEGKAIDPDKRVQSLSRGE